MDRSLKYYILIDRKPVAATLAAWTRSLGTDRHVALTKVNDEVEVSTVFLGLDHRFGCRGEPILFETIVFGGPMDGAGRRYTTWDEAERGHEEVVAEVWRKLEGA